MSCPFRAGRAELDPPRVRGPEILRRIAAPWHRRGNGFAQATSATIAVDTYWPRATTARSNPRFTRGSPETFFMPFVPMVIPSLMAMVLNSMACPRGADPFLHFTASSRQVVIAVHGFVQVLAMR